MKLTRSEVKHVSSAPKHASSGAKHVSSVLKHACFGAEHVSSGAKHVGFAPKQTRFGAKLIGFRHELMDFQLTYRPLFVYFKPKNVSLNNFRVIIGR